MSMTEWPPTLAVPVSPTRDHIRGPQDAAVTNTGTTNVPIVAAHPIVAAVQRQRWATTFNLCSEFSVDHASPARLHHRFNRSQEFWSL